MIPRIFASRSEMAAWLAPSHDLPLAREAAEVVVGGAGALGGDHAGADRPLGRAGGAEHLALPRLDHALEHLAALARLRVGDAHAGHAEAQLRVELGVRLRQLQAAVGDEAQAAPLEVRTQLEDLGHHLERAQVALVGDDAPVLVLDLAAALGELAQDHRDRLQDVQRLEAGDRDRLAVVGGDELERPRADDRRDVARTDEAVEPQVGRLEQRPQRRHDRDVAAHAGEVLDALGPRALQRQRGRRRGRLEPDREEHHLAVGVLLGDPQRVQRRVDHADVGARGLGLEQAAVRARHPHHVAEAGEDHARRCGRSRCRRRRGPSGSRRPDSPGPCTSSTFAGSRSSTPYL